jgi:hypothetical protein
MATLTDKQQTFLGTVGLAGIATCGACLTSKVGVHFRGQGACTCDFISKDTVQFGKGPAGSMLVGPSLLLRCVLAPFAFAPLADVGQVFQADEGVGVLVNNAFGDVVIGVQLQPSLSSADRHQATGRGTSAFPLQAFSQARIMVSFGADLLARIERGLIVGIGRDCQVALPDINPDHAAQGHGSEVRPLEFKTDEQVELLVGLVIPEFGSATGGSLPDECKMPVVASVGDNHAPLEGEDAHPLVRLQAVVTLVVVGEGGRDILGGSIQSLVAFLGASLLAGLGVLLHLGPEGLVGSPDLPGNITSHLGGQLVEQTNLVVHLPLQSALIADLAMRKGILAHRIERITIRQLCLAQCLELFWTGLQFQFSRECYFHGTHILCFMRIVKTVTCVNVAPVISYG